MPKTSKERRRASKVAYLAGTARKPHHHSHALQRSLEESSTDPGPSGVSSVCPQCAPILSRYSCTFREMVHQGSELKWKKSINPDPKRADTTHYRDLVKQNEWLRSNVFDSLGNYLYYAGCMRAALGVSKDRLAGQHNIKRQQLQQPTVTMPKSEVEEKRLGDYVLMPTSLEMSFKRWWSQDPSTLVEIRYPHERHGNAERESNAAKSSLWEEFLEFVDRNSQPNG